jgi:hypothetical protein
MRRMRAQQPEGACMQQVSKREKIPTGIDTRAFALTYVMGIPCLS